MALRLPPPLVPVIAPAAILAAAALALAIGPSLPPSLSGLKEFAAYVLLLAAAGVAFVFNRGRAFVVAASIFLAYLAYRLALEPAADGLRGRMVFTAIALLVPANTLAALLLAERGVRHHRDYRWLLGALGEVLLVAWLASAGQGALAGGAWYAVLDHWLLRSPPTPWLARLLFAAAFIAAVWRAWPRDDARAAPLETGIAVALAAFFIACEWASRPGVFGVFAGAAGAILVVAVLQESYRLAFRDELTGLPGRRALQEALAALGPVYTLAMVDVDHFKQFNDAHGHDVGDQVLKLVATHLAAVQGGGRAFRYGGEEFTLLFPEVVPAKALAHLETVRAAIEAHTMVLRDDDRRRRAARADGRPLEQVLSVTVSMGVAAPGRRARTPDEVMKAADEALYRAKEAGRNRIAR